MARLVRRSAPVLREMVEHVLLILAVYALATAGLYLADPPAPEEACCAASAASHTAITTRGR